MLLLIDPFTDLHEPEQAIAAVEVLHAAGARADAAADCLLWPHADFNPVFRGEAQRVLRELLQKLEGPVTSAARLW